MSPSRELALRRLALRVVRQGDQEAAVVLGDALQERPASYAHGSFATGRVRPVLFIVEDPVDVSVPRTLDRSIRLVRLAIREAMTTRRERSIRVVGRERVYNVAQFASSPSLKTWNQIWVQWVTSKRDVYQALRRDHILPPSVRFREIEWLQNYRMFLENGSGLAWTLFLNRVPHNRRRPVRIPLLSVERRDRSMLPQSTAEWSMKDAFGDRVTLRDSQKKGRTHHVS